MSGNNVLIGTPRQPKVIGANVSLVVLASQKRQEVYIETHRAAPYHERERVNRASKPRVIARHITQFFDRSMACAGESRERETGIAQPRTDFQPSLALPALKGPAYIGYEIGG